MKIIIEPYNSQWPSLFEQEKTALAIILKPWLIGSIEHVGSTSVPQLRAKPIIDIMVGVQGLESSKPAIENLQAAGYCYYPYKIDVMHWFCKPSPQHRTHHLHLVPFRSLLWHERIKFRDILRSNDLIAREYAQLKESLAFENSEDREAYTQAKGPFIQAVLKEYGSSQHTKSHREGDAANNQTGRCNERRGTWSV